MRKFRIIKIIIFILFLTTCCLISKVNSQLETTTNKSYGPTIHFRLLYNAGGYVFWKGASYGGLFGIRAGTKASYPISKTVILWAHPWGRLNYYSWSSSKSDLDSDGYSGSSNLSEYELKSGISVWSVKAFVGYRSFSGTTKDSYDWWTDYTSNIAWDGRYADYTNNSYDEIKLSGHLFGVGYTYYFLRNQKKGLGVIYVLDFNFSTMFIEVGNTDERFYLFEVEYAPAQRGVIGFLSFGKSTISSLFEMSFGVGYQF